MNILDEIIAYKKQEVAERKSIKSIDELEKSKPFGHICFSLKESILDPLKNGVIAEFKRQSPSKGIINDQVTVEEVTAGYFQAGVSGISVLTDEKFFGGSEKDLIKARILEIPILRKDFIIDEYQIVEAKSIGADVILLIAAVLSPKQMEQFTQVAHDLGMEVLLEVHNEEELLANLNAGADLIGVNNRDLTSFEVSLDVSKRLSEKIPEGAVKVSESGLSNPENIVELRKYGYKGFLIGENFMHQQMPGQACADFMQQLELERAAQS